MSLFASRHRRPSLVTGGLGVFCMVIVAFGVGASARSAAAADTLTVGLYAPAALFSGTSDRLAFATGLAEHLAQAVGVERGVGRVYTRAADFRSAVRRGVIDFALVNEVYLAASRTDYRAVAVAVRRGSPRVAWHLVGRSGIRTVGELEGKRLIVPSLGGREDDFVINALFGSEINAGFFAEIETATDAFSTLATLSLQRADAACVPAGLPLPAGVTRIAELPTAYWPLLVALPNTNEDDIAQVRASLSSFAGGEVFSGFEAVKPNAYQAMRRRLRGVRRQGPLVSIPVSSLVARLLRSITFAIEPTDPLRYLDLPEIPASASSNDRR